MKYFSLILSLLSFSALSAQPNCEAYRYNGDTLKYEACKKAMGMRGHYQFSKEYQIALDEALAIDPTFDYAYWAKSIAYLKSGDFITWKRLIDKAVEYNPKDYLGYRGWCRYQFFGDYEGAIKDIEKLDSLVDYDIGESQNGTYHLHVARGLFYRALGEKEKALEIIEQQVKLNEARDYIGKYDYLHLGVLYLERMEFEKAIEMFEKQSQQNEIAENQFYLAVASHSLNRAAKAMSYLEKARNLYVENIRMNDPYSTPMDKIYLKDIEDGIMNTGLLLLFGR